MITIKNAAWSARSPSMGAELKSLATSPRDRNTSGTADPAWWTGSAPVLFPVIGGLKGGSTRLRGSSTSSRRTASRGQASSRSPGRRKTPRSSLFSPRPQTREAYPFDFGLKVSFSSGALGDRRPLRGYQHGARRMYFSIGSHPGFQSCLLPAGRWRTTTSFSSGKNSMVRWFFKDGIIPAGKTEDALDNSRILSLSRSSFDAGIMIFKHPASHEFSIVNSRNRGHQGDHRRRALRGRLDKTRRRSLPRIEPWHGIPDMSDHPRGTRATYRSTLLQKEPPTSQSAREIEIEK